MTDHLSLSDWWNRRLNWLTGALPKRLGRALFHARVRRAIRRGQVVSAHIEEVEHDV